MKTGAFHVPTKVVFGVNVVETLGDIVKSYNTDKVFLVTDGGIVKSGLAEKISNILKKASISCDVFDKVEANPTIPTVHNGAEQFNKNKEGVIIALGGGSAMDAAKGIAVKATHEGGIDGYTRHGGKVVRDIVPPIIAIPTTAGTGSEVTWVSVLVNPEIKRKIVVPSPFIAPKIALVDPVMTVTLPPHITASTGMDALTHAVEAYVSRNWNPISDAYALRAIQLVSNNLRQAVGNGENMEHRYNMSLASTMAGIAFVTAGLGMVHSTAHALGGRCNVPHGVANAIMLPLVSRYNVIAEPEKYRDIAQAMGEDVRGLNAMEAGIEATEAMQLLSEDIGIPKGLKELGLDESLIDQLAIDAMDDLGTFPINPRKANKQAVIDLFKQAFEN